MSDGLEGLNFTRDFTGDGFNVGAQGELNIIDGNGNQVGVVNAADWVAAEVVREPAN